ncbi:glycosyltransferase family 2 protein [Ferruginibacter sp. SUN106]|uniref:glycosyltransferase family 2 protein n=1 Tax=Ferruginibacter sp. SUN106 TaxID=2978348 RepID=UPI003D36843E
MQLSIIIVNYNVKYFLEQCLCSVLKACKNIDAEILVVDNNSNDGSKEFLSPQFPLVHFTWNSVNVGFAKANNQALAQAKGNYVLFLNPDTIVPEDCFENCISFFESHPDAGALGIRMIDGTGKFLKESKRAFPSPLTSLFKLSGFTKLFPHSKIFARYHLGHLSENENHEVDVLAGAYMMIPKKVLDVTAGFDETFFMYGEDVDLSYRIQKTPADNGVNYKNYYFADSTIIHFKGESTKKGSLNYVKLFYSAMSLFVKKHYSGSRAGVFNFLIQIGIFLRAILSLIGKFIQKIGLPVLDAGIIFMSFWCIKYLWSTFIRKEVNYSPNMLIIAFPVFTVIFLMASYYSGLYDKGFKQSQLSRSTGMAALVLLSGYALLPENIRFSRGILVFGIAMAFIIMSLLRWLLLQWGILSRTEDTYRQTIVVAGEKDFNTVTELMHKAGMPEKVLGRVNDSLTSSSKALGSIHQLNHLITRYPVKEIVFCEDLLSFKEIITTIQQLPGGVRNKFHASGSSSIVGSDNKDISGEYLSVNDKYTITNPINRRNKNLLDAAVAIIFLLSFPVHLVLQKKPLRFFKNVFTVLFMQKTWIGYAAITDKLPPIKKGILTSTTLPASLNDLPVESLLLSDEWYATYYSAATDVKKIIRGYKYLGF